MYPGFSQMTRKSSEDIEELCKDTKNAQAKRSLTLSPSNQLIATPPRQRVLSDVFHQKMQPANMGILAVFIYW